MYCKYCGEKIDKDATFCSSCGEKINKDTSLCSSCVEKIDKDEMFYSNCVEKANEEMDRRCGKGDVFNDDENSGANDEENAMAVAGVILSFIVPVLGFIFGCIGLSKSSKKGGKGRELSISAIIISVIVFIAWLE